MPFSGREQIELLPVRRRRMEMRGRELASLFIEAEALAGEFEAASDRPSVGAGAGLPLAPGRIVILAAMQVAHQRDHVLLLVGEVLAQPLAKEILDLERHLERYVARALRPGGHGGV